MNPSTSGASAGITNDIKTAVLNYLKDLNEAIENGNFEEVVKNVDLLHPYISLDKDLLGKLHNAGEQYTTQLDLIISACLHKRAVILYYLLNETDILAYMPETDLSEEEVTRRRTIAMEYAMCSDDFNMPEMLYDYWCGDTHWSSHEDADHVVSTMQGLGLLLKEAHAACEGRLIQEQKMLIDVHSLTSFNKFQCKLYSDIHKLKTKLGSTVDIKKGKAVGTLLLKVLRIYDIYSNIDKVRIKHSINENELINHASIKDKDSIFGRANAYIMYELYFRKLDLSVSLIILENLTVLRNHLRKRFKIKNNKDKKNKPFDVMINAMNLQYTRLAQLYDEIECVLYHFLYRTSEDWRLYLSANRQVTVLENRLGIHNGEICNLNLRYDEEKIYNSPVLFLERKYFKKHLKYLKRIIIKHVICKAPRLPKITKSQGTTAQRKSKPSVNEKELLDDNYLKRMCYLRDYYSLQKIIHYIKVVLNSNELNVLMIERTLQVIGEMMKSSEKSEHISKLTKALLEMELSKETLKRLHNVRLYLSKVEEGQLSRRIFVANGHDQTFINVRKDLEKISDIVKPILDIYKLILDKSLLDKGLDLLDGRMLQLPSEARRRQNEIIDRCNADEDFVEKYMQEVWQHTGLSRDLLYEIPLIADNMENLLKQRQICAELITNHVMNILPKHINNVKKVLPALADNYGYIQVLKNDLKQYKIKELPDWPLRKEIVDIHGKLEENMLKTKNLNQQLLDRVDQTKDLTIDWMCVKNALMFFLYETDRFSVQRTDFDKKVKYSIPDKDTLDAVSKILDEMEHSCGTSQQHSTQNHTFDGIEDLDTNVYIKDVNSANTTRMIRDKWIQCLITRIDQLTKLLDYPNKTLSQCQLRFKRDQKFHVELEMILADIAKVLSKCKIRLMQKSAKMLAGIDLGNVLNHGNPFLEVISTIFDSCDYSAELIKKALMFAEEGKTIKALYKLFSDNISLETIEKDDRQTMTNDQKNNLDVLKLSKNFDEIKKLNLRAVPYTKRP